MTAALIATVGWRDALLAIGVVLLLMVAPLHAWVLPLLMKTHGEGTRTAGEGAAVEVPRPSPQPSPRGRGGRRREGGRRQSEKSSTIREALHSPSFWLVTMTFTLQAFVVAAVWAHIMPMFAALGRSPAQAVAIIVWIGPAQVLGRFLHLAFARSMTARTLGLTVLGALPLALLLLALGNHVAAMFSFAVLFGFGNGVLTIVRGLLVPEYFGRAHVGRIGGAMVAFTLFARAAAPLAAAWLLLGLPGYRELLLLFAGIGATALAIFAIARPAR